MKRFELTDDWDLIYSDKCSFRAVEKPETDQPLFVSIALHDSMARIVKPGEELFKTPYKAMWAKGRGWVLEAVCEI